MSKTPVILEVDEKGNSSLCEKSIFTKRIVCEFDSLEQALEYMHENMPNNYFKYDISLSGRKIYCYDYVVYDGVRCVVLLGLRNNGQDSPGIYTVKLRPLSLDEKIGPLMLGQELVTNNIDSRIEQQLTYEQADTTT